jgi:hypothetical protein
MSLMDALLSIPMADILDRVDVSQDVRARCWTAPATYGAMLSVAEELEGKQCGRSLARCPRPLGLSVKQIREIELAAFDWVRELGADARTESALLAYCLRRLRLPEGSRRLSIFSLRQEQEHGRLLVEVRPLAAASCRLPLRRRQGAHRFGRQRQVRRHADQVPGWQALATSASSMAPLR